MYYRVSVVLLLIGVLFSGRCIIAESFAAEPTNAKEAAAKKAAAEAALDAKYQALVATLSPEQQAWERVLQQELGGFYLPIHKRQKVAGQSNAWDFVEDDPALPRVLLIGDSVSRGYTLAVRSELTGKANVHRAPANCGPTATGLKKIDVWLGDGEWDIIHFNFGIHDRRTPIPDYKQRLEKLIERMKKTGATLVWASTTPIPDTPQYKAASIVDRNAAAAEVMQKHGIAINDLFAAITPHLKKLQRPDDVHFNGAGYKFLGKQVAESLRPLLVKSGRSDEKEAPASAATPRDKTPRAKESDPRLHSDGKGWRVDRAKVTDPDRPRVLLIGDSILNGYDASVIAALKGKAYVDLWVNPYCQSSGLNRKLAEVLKENGPYDVVHFNMGLHGWQEGRIRPGSFEPLTKAYVQTIRDANAETRIIWANTTPVTVKGKPDELEPDINPVIIEHNRMAARVMSKMDVSTNDFYGMLVDRLDLARGDSFHWTRPAYEMMAKMVVASVERELAAGATKGSE